MTPNPQFEQFLSPYNKEIQAITHHLRGFITHLIPEANELIWDNYNALAMAYSKSASLKDAFCHIAVYSKHVNFGFNRGAELSIHGIKLEGKGKLIRHIKVKSIDTFPKDTVKKMIFEAVTISEHYNKDLAQKNGVGSSKVQSISKKKIRPKRS